MTPTRTVFYYDYLDKQWVPLPCRPVEMTVEQARRFIPQTVACLTMFAQLIASGENPGAACLMTLTIMPKS